MMEATRNTMNMGGKVRAKVIKYKSDGNTLTEKMELLIRYEEGIYYKLTPDSCGGEECHIVLEIGGVYWEYDTAHGNVFCAGHSAHKQWDKGLRTIVATFPDIIRENAEKGLYINKMQLEVMRRLGYNIATLQEARNECIRQREERHRRKAEDAERRERERKEAEERRKTEVLSDGKEKLMKGERITVEQIELIAEAVGYKIHIRTLGFMRENVTESVLRDDGTITVWGRKLTSRNIDGTANVMRELCNRLKAQAEEETNGLLRHISEIMETCRLHDEETGEETDEYRYYKWLEYCNTSGNYRTIADKALAEALAWIFVDAYRKGKGHITAMNKECVLIETVIAEQATEMPRISTKTTEVENVPDEIRKAAEMQENAPKRKIEYFHYTPEQLKRYIIDVYEKNANGEWVLLPHEQIDTDSCLWDVVDGKIGWWTNWRREKFSEMNMDFNSPTFGRCCKINRSYQKDNFIVSNEKLLEFTINGNYYYIQKQTYSKGGQRQCYAIMDKYGNFSVNDFSYTEKGIMQRFNKGWKKNATMIWKCRAA